MRTIAPEADMRRAADRFHTRIDWLDSQPSFQFSYHHDPANAHHGLPGSCVTAVEPAEVLVREMPAGVAYR